MNLVNPILGPLRCFTLTRKASTVLYSARSLNPATVALRKRSTSVSIMWVWLHWPKRGMSGPDRCPLFGVERCPLLGGSKCISSMVKSIGGK